MISVEQVKALLDFMEEHPDLALGRSTRSKEGRNLAKTLWVKCGRILNSVSSNCVKKSPDQWRLYYNEYKSKLFKKIKADKAECKATGEPAKKILITPLQTRLYTILEHAIGEPLSGGGNNLVFQQNPEMVVVADMNDESESTELQGELQAKQQGDVEMVESCPEEFDYSWHQPEPSSTAPDVTQPMVATQRRTPCNTEDEPTMQDETQRMDKMEKLCSEAHELAAATREQAAATREEAAATREQASAIREEASAIREQAAAKREQAAAFHRLAAAIEKIAAKLPSNQFQEPAVRCP